MKTNIRTTAASRMPEFCSEQLGFNASRHVRAGDHVVGAFVGRSDGPTLIVIGSLHGNETGGAAALVSLARDLEKITPKLKGRVYFLLGNTRALLSGSRFIDVDLNRSWTRQNLSSEGAAGPFSNTTESIELDELDKMVDSILINAVDEVYVIDLHSTSATGTPFATVGDTLRNRKFAQAFPVPILLGIEEQLEGTMLEHMNNLGAVTLGFEGGQHLSAQTIENHRAITLRALKNAGILDQAEISNLAGGDTSFADEASGGQIFEILYRHAISPDDDFVMTPGFNNFDAIRRGEIVAQDKHGPVKAPRSGVILMPLYQKLGEDGFFIGQRISAFWLWLSAVLRRLRLQNIVHLLPGVKRDPDDSATLIVNTSVARLFPLQIFHLLGFRRRRWVNKKLIVSRRRHDTSGPFKYEGDKR